MTEEAIRSFEIEGEVLSRVDVLSSVRNQLGLNKNIESIKDKRAAGVVRTIVFSRENFKELLSKDRLCLWHKMMMEPYLNINIGQWRSGPEPMQIISGFLGKEEVHFEAPPANLVPREMQSFIDWFNKTAPGEKEEIIHAPIRSAIAHLYFESIHPFEDGNGRIGRIIAEKALSQSLGVPILISLSKTINKDRAAYYEALKKAQRNNQIDDWLKYFLGVLLSSQQEMELQINFTILKTKYFDRIKTKLSARQEKVINKMFDAGPEGFKGGMSVKKYVSITKTSKATATRDLQALVELQALEIYGKGRSTKYQLNFKPNQL